MKKFGMILSILAVLAFMSIPAMAAGPVTSVGSDTGAEVGSHYSFEGWGYAAGGHAHATQSAPTGDSFEITTQHSAAAGVYSGQKVNSDACVIGIGVGKVKTEAYGTAYQTSEAGATTHTGNWANGVQESSASYDASSQSGVFIFGYDESHGNASTVGGTIVGATNFEHGNTTVGMSGAAVGSMGNANAYCNANTNVMGRGLVKQQSYANRGGGEAWTYGTAEYNYSNDGEHHVAGGGFAATGGVSTVTARPDGSITAHAFSGSVSSTGGSINTSGGTYINTLP